MEMVAPAGPMYVKWKSVGNPTTMQLQILEGMFKECNGTPNKVKIKEITFEFLQYGEISETNV
ncbi:hypothetical protein ZOSMA_234G00280 [Zostera marina]|uniref:Uncharacterized protein n=1 Tax=Zostera marina TaxID=29655 RepID=A0A0K9PHY9_ZOSMR|nr:hypothetical protein ZOSMA_234G00280 [Zostera marina]